MRKFALMILVSGVVFALVFGLVTVAFAGKNKWENISGTDHDVGVAGVTPTCDVCHTPHNATSDYLWAKDVSAGEAAGYEPVKAMCYSCHDGTAVAYGIYVFTGTLTQHPFPAAAGSLSATPVEDCDDCHDAHGVAPGVSGQFLVYDGLTYLGANMCKSCHTESVIGTKSHPINADATDKGYTPTVTYSITNPSLATTDFTEGTRLFAGATEDATMGSGNYTKCLSCHAAHGSVTGTKVSSMATTEPLTKKSPLCANCHG